MIDLSHAVEQHCVLSLAKSQRDQLSNGVSALSQPTDPTDESTVNPYASPSSIASATLIESGDLQTQPKPPKPGLVIIKWMLVCFIAAGPSFCFGGMIGNWRGPEVLGMLVGILVFVAGYSAIEFIPQIQLAMNQRAKRRASRTAYISRMVISILFPIGVFFDMYCGVVSLGISSVLTGGEWNFKDSTNGVDFPVFRFLTFLMTTVIQGTLLNILVFAYMLLVYGFLRIIGVDNSSRYGGTEMTQRSDRVN